MIANMVAQKIIDTVLSLPVAEQFELFDRLRERLRDEPLPLTNDQRQLLDERIAAFDADPNEGLPWDEVRAAIEARLGNA